jgi:hypothetical protein
MATPKEQRDARSNARNIGHPHRHVRPADATPPRGVPAAGDDPHEDSRIREPRGDRPPIGDPPR